MKKIKAISFELSQVLPPSLSIKALLTNKLTWCSAYFFFCCGMGPTGSRQTGTEVPSCAVTQASDTGAGNPGADTLRCLLEMGVKCCPRLALAQGSVPGERAAPLAGHCQFGEQALVPGSTQSHCRDGGHTTNPLKQRTDTWKEQGEVKPPLLGDMRSFLAKTTG